MSTLDNASPDGGTAEAGSVDSTVALPGGQVEQTGQAGEGGADGAGGEPAAKVEKTAEQREIDRLRRRVDNLTRQKYELRAATPATPQQQPQQQQAGQQDADEPVTMTRAEMQKHIAEQAKQLAPTMSEQQAEADRRHGVVQSLEKTWGGEKFDTMSAELDEAFGGLTDRSGVPKAATDAIFQSDNPQGVIEYLTDPDNADEAHLISKMSAVQAGRAIGRLEDKLAAEKSKNKPKPSNAAAPLEPVRGAGAVNGMPDPSNTKAYMAWANAQERANR